MNSILSITYALQELSQNIFCDCSLSIVFRTSAEAVKMSQGKKKIENCDFAAATDSGQSTQPPVKKIKLEQLEQPSTTGSSSSAAECLGHLQQNISSEPPYVEFLEKTQEYEEDYDLHVINEALRDLRMGLDCLEKTYFN